jgi:hypothetical protein
MHRDTSDLPPSVLGIGVTYWKRAAAMFDISLTAPGQLGPQSAIASCSAIVQHPTRGEQIAVFVLDDESLATESLVERCFVACQAAGMRCSVMILRDRNSLDEAQDALQDWGIVPKSRL